MIVRVLAIVLVIVLVVGCASPAQPLHAIESDAGHDAASAARFDDCARCHVRIASDHAASLHARAFDDPLFQREWSQRRHEGCVGCHAPEATDASDPRAHDGVGCASCHVIDGAITSRQIGGRAPHASVADARFGDPERCGTCHEFDFARGTERLQRTLSEWHDAAREETCASCHMPSGSHRLRGPRDPSLLAEALSIDVTAVREGRSVVVRASLRVTGAGHAVPTGDLNRNLVLRAWRGEGAPVVAELSRLFARDEDGHTIEIADQRVLPGVERRLALRLPPGRGAVRWSLTWNALPIDAHADAIDATFRTREIGHGTVPIGR